MKWRNSSGVLPTGSEPSATMRSRMSGALRILISSSCSRVDERLRHLRRPDHAVPADHLEARQRFGDRRERRAVAASALRRGDREAAQLAGAHLRLRALQAGEVEVVLAGEQVGHRRTRALVGDVLGLDAGHQLVELAREVAAAADAGRAEVERALVALRPLDELRAGSSPASTDCTTSISPARGELRDRREVVDRVIGQLRIERRVDRVLVVSEEQRVAVGRAPSRSARRRSRRTRSRGCRR